MPVPEAGPRRARIRVRGCGVCASSLPLWQGREWFTYPLAPGEPGHEAWGVVDAIGEGVRGLRYGDCVATLACNAFAEYVVAEADSIVVLPQSLHQRDFPGEALGCALNIFSRSMIARADPVAIVGSGFLGAALTQLCASAGARVMAISRGDYSLQLARMCGAQCVLRAASDSAIMEVARAFAGPGLFPRVIEAGGAQETLTLAGQLTGEAGRLILAGYHQDGPRLVDMQLWNWRGFDVINAHERRPEIRVAGVRQAIDAVSDGRLRLDLLGMRRFELSQLDEAFESIGASHSGFAKALVRI
jgi:threonine dehydrogenase-like Zn-dependent dehydrogenase